MVSGSGVPKKKPNFFHPNGPSWPTFFPSDPACSSVGQGEGQLVARGDHLSGCGVRDQVGDGCGVCHVAMGISYGNPGRRFFWICLLCFLVVGWMKFLELRCWILVFVDEMK